MQRKWIILSTVLAAALPGVLAAQRTPRTPRPPRAPRAYAYSMSDHHGRIGVVPNSKPDSQTDKIGARLEAVTPGGPAAKAGLKVGDIITKFNGTSLAGAQAEDEDESGPSAKLVELARKLEPGDTVQVEYRSGDVILSIAGRKPTSPSHAMRILHSYEAGETVSLDIVRKQKRMTVTWKVPTREERTLMRHHEREDQSRLRLETRRRLRMRQV